MIWIIFTGWDKCVNITRFCQRFTNSCRFYPGSPCNQIIQAFFLREESDSVIESCVKNIRGESTIVPYVNRKSKKTLDQEIDCDISSELLKITASLFKYYWKNDGSVYNLWFWFFIDYGKCYDLSAKLQIKFSLKLINIKISCRKLFNAIEIELA